MYNHVDSKANNKEFKKLLNIYSYNFLTLSLS